MKNIVKNTIISIVSCLIIYLIGAFMAWDIDPQNWSEFGRIIAGVVFLLSILSPLIYDSIEDSINY